MSKIAVIIGTRPEAIKLIPVFIELRKQLSKDQLVLISTGQHKEMLAQVFDLFEIQPTINLEVMENNQTLNQLIAKIFGQLDQVLTQENITSLIVQGDTSTAMASAITAFNRKINVFHVEAGLRSGNLLSPFPEEGNRKIISAFANLHFTPTMNATQNLLNEGVSAEQIKEVGNTVIDAVEMRQDPFLEGGVRLGYLFAVGKYDLEIAAYGRNITDETALIGGVTINNLAGVVNEGRLWGADFKVKF